MGKIEEFLKLVGENEEWAISIINKYLSMRANKKQHDKKYRVTHKDQISQYQKQHAKERKTKGKV